MINDYYFVIVEGFLLYYSKEVCDFLDIRFWIDIDQKTCRTRRVERDGCTKEWFDDMVWLHYLKYLDTQKQNADPVVVISDEGQGKTEIFKTCMNEISKRFPTHE